MPDGWEETIEGMPDGFTKALWNLGRNWNAMVDELDRLRQREALDRVLSDIVTERARQIAVWGDQRHPDGTGPEMVWSFTGPAEFVRNVAQAISKSKAADGHVTWLDILLEEVAEAFAESDLALLRTELVQAAAIIANWVHDIDRRA